MKTIKKLLAIILCAFMIFSCIQISAFASVSTMNQNITSNTCSLEISGINSYSTAKMTVGKSMSLSIKMELQKVKSGVYTTIETWSSSKTGTSLSMEETRLINMLATYRLKVTFTAGSEKIVLYAYPWLSVFSQKGSDNNDCIAIQSNTWQKLLNEVK